VFSVEGVNYHIDWYKFRYGASIFIPCLNTAATKRQMKRMFRRMGVKTLLKVTIEDGIQGLRIWRM
jgi:hypothetical protein